MLEVKQPRNGYCWQAFQALHQPWLMNLLKFWHHTKHSAGVWPYNNDDTNHDSKVCSWKNSLQKNFLLKMCFISFVIGSGFLWSSQVLILKNHLCSLYVKYHSVLSIYRSGLKSGFRRAPWSSLCCVKGGSNFSLYPLHMKKIYSSLFPVLALVWHQNSSALALTTLRRCCQANMQDQLESISHCNKKPYQQIWQIRGCVLHVVQAFRKELSPYKKSQHFGGRTRSSTLLRWPIYHIPNLAG